MPDSYLPKSVIYKVDAPYIERVEAAACLLSSPDTTWKDLITCLSLGGYFSSLAATTLHARTKRPPTKSGVGGLITDSADWTRYFVASGIDVESVAVRVG